MSRAIDMYDDRYLDELTPNELMEIVEAQDKEFNDLYEELIEVKSNKAAVIAMGTLAGIYILVSIIFGFIDMIV